LSKIKCFHYHEFRHYATKCPHKKESKKEIVVAATCEALPSQFHLDFTLITCMASTVMESVWHLDLGAPFHMTRNREFFSDLHKKHLKMNIEFWDDKRDRATDIGTVAF